MTQLVVALLQKNTSHQLLSRVLHKNEMKRWIGNTQTILSEKLYLCIDNFFNELFIPGASAILTTF